MKHVHTRQERQKRGKCFGRPRSIEIHAVKRAKQFGRQKEVTGDRPVTLFIPQPRPIQIDARMLSPGKPSVNKPSA